MAKVTRQASTVKRVRRKMVRASNLYGKWRRGMAYRAATSLEGDDFVTAANLYIERYIKSGITLAFEPDTNEYLVKDGTNHRFTNPNRLWYFVHGAKWRAEHLSKEYFLPQIDFSDGDVIVETGGNIGDFGLALGLTRCRLKLISFEPSPQEFASLKRNLAGMQHLIKPEAHQIAAWHENGSFDFFVKTGSADNSLLAPPEYDEKITVSAKRLDDMLPRRRYKLLKLEAEGAEPEILLGAEGIIDCFEYVSCDVGFERGLAQDSTLPEVTNFLLERGFEVVAFGALRHVVLYRNRKVANA